MLRFRGRKRRRVVDDEPQITGKLFVHANEIN